MEKVQENKLISRICEVCGAKFTTSDINEHYCSEACRILADKEKREKTTSNSIIGKLKTHRCKSCGKKFMSFKTEDSYCNDCEKS